MQIHSNAKFKNYLWHLSAVVRIHLRLSLKAVQPVTISHGDVSNNTGKSQCCTMFYDLQNNMMYLICDNLQVKHHFWNFS